MIYAVIFEALILIALSIHVYRSSRLISSLKQSAKEVDSSHSAAITFHVKQTEEQIEQLNKKHKEELDKIRKFSPNIEALALSFNDLNTQNSGLLKLTRVDPDKMFEWNPNR